MQEQFSFSQKDISAHFTSTPKPDPAMFKMHTHERCELYYFIEGKGTFHIEGSSYPLESGDILLMRPAEAHYIVVAPSHRYTRFVINFDPQLISSVDPDGFLLQPFTGRTAGRNNQYRSGDFPNDLYRRCLQNTMSDSPNRRLQLFTNLLPLLNEIATVFLSKSNHSQVETLESRIVSYINKRIADDLTLDEICRKFYISKPHLCRIFKNITGSTVWDYITVKRLLNAKQLIQTGVPPTIACTECGFGDYSAFYRAYRKKYGVSPSESKKQ